MKLTYDPRYNIAYLRFHEKIAPVNTVHVSDSLNVDVAEDGTIFGIEFLNANEQLKGEDQGKFVVVNEALHSVAELALDLTATQIIARENAASVYGLPMEQIIFAIQSHSHRISSDVFGQLNQPESQTLFHSIEGQVLKIGIGIPMHLSGELERKATFGLRIASDLLVGLNVATFGFFTWASGMQLHWSCQHVDSKGNVTELLLAPQPKALYEGLRGISVSDLAKVLAISAAMNREHEAMFRAEYLKGLVHLTAGYAEIDFSREAFGNFYRGLEYFVTSRVLKVKSLSNECKDIQGALGSLGLDEEMCKDFVSLYKIKCNQVMHAQKPQQEISTDDILKIKTLFDFALHKFYLDNALELMKTVPAGN